MTDDIAERARKIGAAALHSIMDISTHQRLSDNNNDTVSPLDMLRELRSDNRELTRFLRVTHEVCDKHHDVATASLIETWIDETERRSWFLTEIVAGLEEESRGWAAPSWRSHGGAVEESGSDDLELHIIGRREDAMSTITTKDGTIL
jgi:Ferritin-like domain